jgi:hypothetical protein
MASVLATALAPVFTFGAVYLGTQSTAQAAVEKAGCQVHAILFSKEGDGKLPKNLEFLRKHIESDDFAIYKGYHLLDKKVYQLVRDAASESEFKSGHKLGLTLLGGDAGKLKLHSKLVARDGKTALLDTAFSIEDNGLIMFSPGKFTSGEVAGKLFFAVQCKSRG